MWKPTKKQHLVNKKYADENGGGSGSPLIINGVLDGSSLSPTYEPIEPNLSAADLIAARVVLVKNGELVSTQIIIGAGTSAGGRTLLLNTGSGRLEYEPSTGALQTVRV